MKDSIVKFFKNKNTITILGVIIIIALLYFGYTSQIKSQTSPVRVPIAKETIQPRTLITEEMIDYVNMPSAGINAGVIRTSANIVGKYTSYNTVVPEGSMFYTSTIISKEEMPDSAFVEVKEGEVPYQFPVSMESTFGNSIFPGNKIDIYMKAVDDDGIMVGKLLQDVEVLAVKDSQGNHVFENTAENRTPAYLIFGVSDEINILLKKASYMSNFSVELFPVPHGGWVTSEGETEISTAELKDFINANTKNLSTNSGTNNSNNANQNNTNTSSSTNNSNTNTTTGAR